ncbi:hypothetical protein [Planktotalea arctica]|uniref:hypothetical protein n=1 Tax=Planktotalea arctica TaxID=1481893 RepID=UPI0023B50A1C
MIILHTGFDGLDFALKSSAPPELVAKLEEAKALACETHTETLVTHNGVRFKVAETGGKGGYAYRFDTGPDGATWFIKKPKPGDPWGVRISCHSRGLGLSGLDAVRRDIEATCDNFNLAVPPDGVSIGRVDFAVDIFSPHFKLVPEHFIMHARSRRKTFADLNEMQTHGPSGRFTSVTIGKQPGRQVIVYDKREEVLSKRKVEWPMIWNRNLKNMGLPELDPFDKEKSQVWRVELRMGKKALRERGNIRGFGSLYERLQAEMNQLVQDVTLHVPSGDTNRSRWPLHPLWKVAAEAVATRLFNHIADVPPEVVRDMNLLDKQYEFERSIASFAVTLAVLESYDVETFPFFLERLPMRIVDFLDHHPRDTKQRFIAARKKYAEVLGA